MTSGPHHDAKLLGLGLLGVALCPCTWPLWVALFAAAGLSGRLVGGGILGAGVLLVASGAALLIRRRRAHDDVCASCSDVGMETDTDTHATIVGSHDKDGLTSQAPLRPGAPAGRSARPSEAGMEGSPS